MKNWILGASVTAMLLGCSTIGGLWPRPHDPVLFDHLVRMDIALDHVNCQQPDWRAAIDQAEQLARYAEWRHDPQSTNLRGLQQHVSRMSQGGSRLFCDLGKKTAHQRTAAARTAWERR